MEILQNLESPKWKKILTVEIIVFLILVAGSILLEKYSNEMEFGLLFNMEIFTILGVSSLIFSSKTTARYLAIDDNNLIFKRMLGTTLLPLAEIASIGKADDQLYGRNKDKLADPNGEARKIYGQAKDESKSRFDKKLAYAGWCKRGTGHKYYLFSAQRDNHALITTKDGKLYVVDYENAEAIKQKARLD